VAFGKSGSNLTLWINGQQQGTTTWSANMNTTTFQLKGATGQTTNLANLQVGPIRISNSAVYTTGANFTPPTTFSRTANTTLLLQGGNTLSAYLTDQSGGTAPTVSIIGNTVSGSQNVNYGVPGNVVGDISGATNSGLFLRNSNTSANTQGSFFYNNYGGYWNFNNTANLTLQPTSGYNSTNSWSLSTWFQTSSANTGFIAVLETGISSLANTGNRAAAMYVNTSTGALIGSTYAGGFVLASGTGNVANNRWNHAALTYSSTGSASVTSLYINGNLSSSVSTSAVIGSIPNSLWKIGNPIPSAGWTQPGMPTSYYSGNVGPTAAYTSVLTANQVSQIYRTQIQRFGNATIGNTTANFSYTGNVQTFTVPFGVNQITARVIGGAGGRGQGPSQGGAGANIAANLSVTPGQTLYMIVGRGGNVAAGAGSTAGNLIQGGGGAAGTHGGNTYPGAGGGGFSGLFTQSPSDTSVAASSALLIAGGGGGGGGSSNQTNGSNAAISLTGQASQGSGFSSTYFMTSGWSSTGTQIVGNLTQVNGVNLTQVAPANYFSTGAAVQLTGVGNVLAGQYLTVASAAGNLVYFNNGNVSPFPNAGNTGGNTAFSLFNFITAWNNTNAGGGIGGGNSALTGGASGLMYGQLNSPLGTVISSATAGSAWQGGNGGNSTGGLVAAGGGGGGGYFGGGGGIGAGGQGGSGGGGGSNYVSPAVFNGVTYGNLTVAASVGVPLHGNIQLSWANTANFGYTTGTVQTFTVPPYVTRLTARVVGAAGGPGLLFQTTPSTYYAPGGGGANISATLTVTPGQTLYVIAGQGGYAPDYNLFPAGNIATGNLTQGGGGGSYNAGAGTPGIGGSSGGGFSGIFTADPTSNAIAANSAVLIAGGGGGGTVQAASSGGNAATTINGNASAGGNMQASTAFLQSATAITSNGTNVTITLSNTQTNKVNYSVGGLFGIAGSNIASNWIGKVLTANATTIVADYGGGAATPAAGTYSAGLVYPGGYNGTGVAGFNNSAGGGSPSFGGYPCPSFVNGTLASTIAPLGGTQFFGGQNGYALSTNPGGAGGGGWYGGGGGGNGGQAVGPLSGGGGGSNYANAQMVTNVAYGTITTNTNSNNAQLHGYVTFSW
jgi:hypothetical protein